MNGAAAAIANAIKASGAIVQVDTNDFTVILSKADKPIVVVNVISPPSTLSS